MIRFLTILIFISSCGFEQENPDNLARFNYDEDIIVWNQNNLPLSLGCDTEITEQELEECDRMIAKWEQASQQQFVKDYYRVESRSFENLEDYYVKDENIAVYRAKNKMEGIATNVLAVCQLYIRFVDDLGDRNLYEIIHADIVFNGADFQFNDGGQDGKFDFATVFLHEFGHFIGLKDSGKDNTMDGKMASTDVNREIDLETEQKAYDLYNNDYQDHFDKRVSKVVLQPIYRVKLYLKEDGRFEYRGISEVEAKKVSDISQN